MYPIPAVYQRTFNQLIQTIHWLADNDLFWAFCWKVAWFYCRWLQNNGALNFVQFFCGPAVKGQRSKIVFEAFRYSPSIFTIIQ